MTAALKHGTWILFLAAGCALLCLYAAIVLRADVAQDRQDAAIVAGLGLALLLAAAFGVFLAVGSERTVRFPPIWASVLIAVIAIGCGAVVARSDRWPAVDPLLAVVAVAATFTLIAGIAVYWSPNRAIRGRSVFGPGLWGMTAAPFIALVLELVCAIALFAGAIAGLYIADPDLVQNISDRGVETIVDQSGNRLVTTTTVIIGLFAIYAILAPMAEEYAKLLGSLTLLRGRGVTRFDAYLTGVFVGLGFASVETLAYALAAGERWPLVAAIRAPVALVHVTAASTASLGWFATYSGRRTGIVGGYLLAVLIHGAWNALMITALVISASVEDPEALPPVQAAALLGIGATMTLFIGGAIAGLVVSARRFGRESGIEDTPGREQPPASDGSIERMSVAASPSLGSV